MNMPGGEFATNGVVNLYNVEGGRFSFEVNVEIMRTQRPDVNQIALFGSLIVDSETMIQHEDLNYPFREMPGSSKYWIKHKMRKQIEDHIRETH